MRPSTLAADLHILRGVVACNRHSEDSDETLLQTFVDQREASAFATIVRRHGSMVLHVCRRVLGHQQDAEDAFQATFLVLARQAATLRKKTALASFLHGTAYRLALFAKRTAARRRKYEGQTPARPFVDPAEDLSWREVRTLLDEEIARLPKVLRSVFILCCLEELSQAEAGRRLGLNKGTVANRLAEARKRLGQRLTRRGVELTAMLTATSVAASQAPALSAELMANTIKAAATDAPSASVAKLMQESALGVMSRKTKMALALLLAATVLGGAGFWFAQSRQEQETSQRPVEVKTSELTPRRAPETLVLRGRVLGPDDKPVAGAKLYLPRPGEVTLVERTATDKEGRFTIEVPRTEARADHKVPLIATASGFGLAWIDLPQKETADELTLRLVKDVAIRGRLVSTDGKPIAGVTVNVRGLMAFERLDDFLRVFRYESGHVDEGTGARRLNVPLNKVLDSQPTDKDGRFEIRGVGVERVVGLEVNDAALARTTVVVVTREGFDAKAYQKNVIRRKGEPNPQLFGPSFEYVVENAVARKTKVIEGVVREAGSGKPIAGAMVDVAGTSAVTDAKGHYRLAGVRLPPEPGTYMLNVVAPRDRSLIGRGVPVPRTPDDKPLHVDVELPRGVVVTGRLYDKVTGKGVPGWVTFAPLPKNKNAKAEGLLQSAQASADGRFHLTTIAGPGVLLAQAYANFKIDGVPISPYKRAEFDAADRPRIKMVHEQGSYRYFDSADGLTALDIFNTCKVLDVKDDGKPVSCDLAFDPGKTQSVNLVDPDGKSVSGVVVAGVGAETHRAVPFKTATGRIYALDPDNPRTVVFLHVERKLAAVAKLGGDAKEPLTVRLAPAGVVSGRVLDGDGQPLAGAEAYTLYKTVGRELTTSALRWSAPRTDKDGRFRVETVVPGIEMDFGFIKGRQMLVPAKPLEIKPLQSGQTLDVGDVRVKPRRS